MNVNPLSPVVFQKDIKYNNSYVHHNNIRKFRKSIVEQYLKGIIKNTPNTYLHNNLLEEKMKIEDNLFVKPEPFIYDIYKNRLPNCEEASINFKSLNHITPLNKKIPIYKNFNFEGKSANFINKFSTISKKNFESKEANTTKLVEPKELRRSMSDYNGGGGGGLTISTIQQIQNNLTNDLLNIDNIEGINNKIDVRILILLNTITYLFYLE